MKKSIKITYLIVGIPLVILPAASFTLTFLSIKGLFATPKKMSDIRV